MMQIQKVIKYNGESQNFAPHKLLQTLQRAAQGFSVDLNKIINQLPNIGSEEISTTRLQQEITMMALNLTSVEEPEWKNIAGRLKLFELYKKTMRLRNKNHQPIQNLYDYTATLDYATQNNVYTTDIFKHYTKEELKEASTFINPQYDLIYDYAVSTNRYPFGTMTANVGDISNKGIELTINAIPVQTRDFTWSTSINLSHNKNVVEKLSNETYSVDYIDQANPDVGGYTSEDVQRIMEGCPIGQFYLWEWAGYDENGNSVFNDYDENGNLVGTTDTPGDGDRRKAGSAQPKLTYGWNNDLTYKNWTLNLFFQGVAGNKIYNATRNYYNNVGLVANGKNVLSEVASEQNVRDSRSHAPSDRYLENGSYFRLASLTLGYNFGKLGNWVNNLRLYATCNNVFTITGYKGVDPEIYLGGLTPGVDWRNTTYPRTRTFMVGVNVNF